MKVGVVIVTYADRSNFFQQVLNRLKTLKEVSNIILVLNGVEGESLNRLSELERTIHKLKIVDLKRNTGSAKGFKEGIQAVLNEDIEYLWLLDDDNLPNQNALEELFNYLKENELDIRDSLFSLLSYRPEREIYKQAIQTKQNYLMLGSKNSFLGFNILEKLKKNTKILSDLNIISGQVAVAPYGGMFFHKTLIKKIGLPNESFFLYADDHEFSFRITQKGGKIMLILNSELQDLETSFHLKKKKGILHTRYFSTNSKDAIYYSVRNNIYFEKKFAFNNLIYNFNKVTYVFMLFLIMIFKPKHFWKFPLIIKAIKASKKL